MQITHQDDVLFLKGDVTAAHITREDYRSVLQACQPNLTVVDLSGVEAVDSSCVALLVTIKRQLGKSSWQLRNAPATVVSLLQLYELEWLA